MFWIECVFKIMHQKVLNNTVVLTKDSQKDALWTEEDLEATQVISKDDNNVMFKGFCPDDGESEQEDRSLPVKIHQDERDYSSQEEGETTGENDETVKAISEKTTPPQPPVLQRHTYRLEGPDGVNEIHAETIDELLEKMKVLVVQDAMEAAEATSPPASPFTDGGVNKNKVDGASPVSTDDDDDENEEEGLISDDEEEEEEILRFWTYSILIWNIWAITASISV